MAGRAGRGEGSTVASVVDMYTAHPSPSRRDKLGFAGRRMELRLSCCGVEEHDFRDRRVLDAGCGTGEYACWFASRGAGEVVGIDLSPTALEEARACAKEQGLENARFERRSVLDTGLPDGSFDLVYCTGVLHHTEAPFEGLRELCRVGRARGKLLVSLYHSGGFLPRLCRWHVVRLLAGEDRDERVRWARRLFPRTCRRLTDTEAGDAEALLYDYFAVPHQSLHSVGEVLAWFDELGIRYLGSFPPARLSDYPPLFRHPAYASLEADLRSPVHRAVAWLGEGEALPRERPTPTSRALTYLLWTFSRMEIFSTGGELPGKVDRSTGR